MRVDRIHESQWPAYLADFMATDETAEYFDELNWWHTLMSDRDQKSFAIGGVPGGAAWPEWELQTWRTMQLGDHDTLVATGRLMNSLVRGGDENVDTVGPRESFWGTTVPYAEMHNQGASTTVSEYLYDRSGQLRKRPGDAINIPQRPFATLNDDMLDGLAELVADSLVEKLKE